MILAICLKHHSTQLSVYEGNVEHPVEVDHVEYYHSSPETPGSEQDITNSVSIAERLVPHPDRLTAIGIATTHRATTMGDRAEPRRVSHPDHRDLSAQLLIAQLERTFGRKEIALGHMFDAITLAEAYYAASFWHQDFLSVWWGDSIDCRLVRWSGNVPSSTLLKLGHTRSFGHDTKPCTCGHHGCLNSYCSRPALAQSVRGHTLDEFRARRAEALNHMVAGLGNTFIRCRVPRGVACGEVVEQHPDFLREVQIRLQERLTYVPVKFDRSAIAASYNTQPALALVRARSRAAEMKMAKRLSV